ncbi:MAG: hypothetical protein AB7O24_12065 [Kofleriaceae bacterium]
MAPRLLEPSHRWRASGSRLGGRRRLCVCGAGWPTVTLAVSARWFLALVIALAVTPLVAPVIAALALSLLLRPAVGLASRLWGTTISIASLTRLARWA